MPESLDSLCKDGVRIVGCGNPQRGVERGSIEEPGGSFRIHRPDRSLVDKRLDRLRRRAKARILVGPSRWIAEHSRPVQQHDALDLRLQRHLDIGDALVEKSEPSGLRPILHSAHPRQHFCVDLVDHGLQQALLVAEVVVERAARQAGFGGQIVHRRRRIAFGRESLPGGLDELGPGLLHHLRASPRDHHHLQQKTYAAYAS